ncbi:MAG: BatA domain-containing protein [Planctomycetaceae bacterium]
MSFLTPLYLLGIAAVSLPVVFHLIRRSPQGQTEFSSLMFVPTSPPRLTRRSRLDQLLLLLLRALALLLLAAAFTRPFFRQAEEKNLYARFTRRVAILVDTSASMSRGQVWQQAITQVEDVLQDLEPGEDVALYTFGNQLRPVVPFGDGGRGQDPRTRVALVRSQLATLKPSFEATNLGGALVNLADAMEAINAEDQSAGALQIVLVSDLQQGSQLESLQAFDWPEEIRLSVRRIADTGGNVELHTLVAHDEDDSGFVRVRVSNVDPAGRQEFTLRWQQRNGEYTADDPFPVYVPDGESRLVKMPLPETQAVVDRIELTGDVCDFDNIYYVNPRQQITSRVLYLGSDPVNDPQGLAYYLERSLIGNRWRIIEFASRSEWGVPAESVQQSPVSNADDAPKTASPTVKSPAAGTPPELSEIDLVVVATDLDAQHCQTLRQFVIAGGRVLFVLVRSEMADTMARLLDRPAVEVSEADVDDYAMLADIDFQHPLFAAFADPRFSDFTKIRFWKHRQVDVTDDDALQVVARFDDGDPAVIESMIGQGRIVILSTGWQPSDSRFALSSKFVPWMTGMLHDFHLENRDMQRLYVGDLIPLTADTASQVASSSRKIIKPDGSEVRWNTADGDFGGVDQPGPYRIQAGETVRSVAVNLQASESDTRVLPVEALEERGVLLGVQATPKDMAEHARQMRDLELEDQQRVWQWLVVALICVLIAETWLAGHVERGGTTVAAVEAGE